jgi:hypothetical protein
MNPEIKKLWYQAGLGFNDQQCEPEVIERFAELIIDRCADSVIGFHPSEKTILHEPYRTIMNNVMETFNNETT